jgi:hypothetical protein
VFSARWLLLPQNHPSEKLLASYFCSINNMYKKEEMGNIKPSQEKVP